MPRGERTSPFLSGIILAAGASTRMGQPKQLLPLGGRPLLQHVIDEAASSCLDELILVLGHQAEEVRAAIHIPGRRRIQIVINREYASGQSISLQLGLGSASQRAEGAAILLGDQPQVMAELIDLVTAAFCRTGSPVVRPVYAGADGHGVPGHPVFLARRLWPYVKELSGDEGARAILAAHPEWLFEVQVEGEPPSDIDTWEDYLQAAGREQKLARR